MSVIKWTATRENRSLVLPIRSCTNRSVQLQKLARSLKFRILKVGEWFYPCSENKGADQLCSYCTADLRLCFRIGENPVFSLRGLNANRVVIQLVYVRMLRLFHRLNISALCILRDFIVILFGFLNYVIPKEFRG